MLRSRPQGVEGCVGWGAGFCESAGGPEQAPVPFTLTTPRYPTGEHLRIRAPLLKPSSTRTVDGDRGAGVKELAQPRRIHRRRGIT